MPQSDGGPRVVFSDTDPAGCPLPDGWRAWLANNRIEDPAAVSNGGGAGVSDPVNYGVLAQQIENLTNANTALVDRVAELETLPKPSFGTQAITAGTTTVNITGVPTTGTRFLTQIVGGALENFRVNAESGTVVCTWDNAAPGSTYVGWMRI